jgi:hypothetical protein
MPLLLDESILGTPKAGDISFRLGGLLAMVYFKEGLLAYVSKQTYTNGD